MTAASPEHRAFLRAICESPVDDLPRLVFADFLEEQAGMVACGECKGTGRGEKWIEFEGNWFPIPCPHCSGTGRVSNGNADQSEAIRWMIDHPEVHWVCLCEQRPGEVCHACQRIPGAREIPRRAAPGVFGETPYVVHRGFVSEVRVPTLATLFGGRCDRCDGRGGLAASSSGRWVPHSAAPKNCVPCRGTGRTPGIAAAVFAEHPITRVIISDAIIHPSGGNDTYYVGGLGVFPQKYWSRLENHRTRQSALEALSAVCVAFGKEAAFRDC